MAALSEENPPEVQGMGRPSQMAADREAGRGEAISGLVHLWDLKRPGGVETQDFEGTAVLLTPGGQDPGAATSSP